MAQASAHCPGRAAHQLRQGRAAIAEALPHSACSRPPPRRWSRVGRHHAEGPAVKRLITAASRVHLPSASRDATVPGNIPQEPAVGAATMRPMAGVVLAHGQRAGDGAPHEAAAEPPAAA